MYWFEDNAVVLSGLAKGASHGEELDRGNAAAHLMLAELRARCWFEYIESKSNWADGAGRLLEADPWIHAHHFQVTRGEVPHWPWLAPAEERLTWVKYSCS